jgi:hypothetical protein
MGYGEEIASKIDNVGGLGARSEGSESMGYGVAEVWPITGLPVSSLCYFNLIDDK